MPGDFYCQCQGLKSEVRKNWVVDHRYHNHSAFNGYHKTYSDYSQVRCLKCNRIWRSKAKYVYGLPDAEGTDD